jgi:hypothetical protein
MGLVLGHGLFSTGAAHVVRLAPDVALFNLEKHKQSKHL